MTQKYKHWIYDLVSSWLHPALGGMCIFVIAGLLFNIAADPLAIIFVVYVVLWCILADFLNYLGWNRS